VNFSASTTKIPLLKLSLNGKQRIVLKYGMDIAAIGADAVDILIANSDFATVRNFKATN